MDVQFSPQVIPIPQNQQTVPQQEYKSCILEVWQNAIGNNAKVTFADDQIEYTHCHSSKIGDCSARSILKCVQFAAKSLHFDSPYSKIVSIGIAQIMRKDLQSISLSGLLNRLQPAEKQAVNQLAFELRGFFSAMKRENELAHQTQRNMIPFSYPVLPSNNHQYISALNFNPQLAASPGVAGYWAPQATSAPVSYMQVNQTMPVPSGPIIQEGHWSCDGTCQQEERELPAPLPLAQEASHTLRAAPKRPTTRTDTIAYWRQHHMQQSQENATMALPIKMNEPLQQRCESTSEHSDQESSHLPSTSVSQSIPNRLAATESQPQESWEEQFRQECEGKSVKRLKKLTASISRSIKDSQGIELEKDRARLEIANDVLAKKTTISGKRKNAEKSQTGNNFSPGKKIAVDGLKKLAESRVIPSANISNVNSK